MADYFVLYFHSLIVNEIICDGRSTFLAKIANLFSQLNIFFTLFVRKISVLIRDTQNPVLRPSNGENSHQKVFATARNPCHYMTN